MNCLVAIEGGDGAGKATAAQNVSTFLAARGWSANTVSFPRYTETVGGFALGEFLAGRMPRAMSPRAAAVLYALDRAESTEELIKARDLAHVTLLDRYIASNIAYQTAQVPSDQAEGFRDWIVALETKTFGLAQPDLTIYLDTPLDTAQSLILRKQARTYTERGYDEYEQDLELQRCIRDNYQRMVEQSVLGPWHTIRTVDQSGVLRSAMEIAAEIGQLIIDKIASSPVT